MIVLTYVAIADEPVHSDTTKLIDTTSARPPYRIRCSAGAIVEWTALGTMTWVIALSIERCRWLRLSAPSGPLKKPIVPRMARIAEGSATSCQKPASAASPKMRCCQERRIAVQTNPTTDVTGQP